MDNPCKHCPKANPDFVNDSEYGCNTPCKSANDFWDTVSKRLDEMFERTRVLLKGGSDNDR